MKQKLDLNTIIGYILLVILMAYLFLINKPEETSVEEKEKIEQKENTSISVDTNDNNFISEVQNIENDSIKLLKLKAQIGTFAYSATLPSATENTTTIENDLLRLVISNKGGQPKEIELKKFKTYDSLPLYLVKNNKSVFNLSFKTSDNRGLNTKDLYFEPTLSKNGENQILSMKLKVSPTEFLEYVYEIKPDNYMVGFNLRSQGMSKYLSVSDDDPVLLQWDFVANRVEKSGSYENQYSALKYKYDDGKIDNLSERGDDEEIIEDVDWIAYKQHFFSSFLIPTKPLKKAEFATIDLTLDKKDSSIVALKRYITKAPLEISGGEFNQEMNWYFGPSDYNLLKEYDLKMERIINHGWGIFGWIGRGIFTPVFNVLKSFMSNYGLIIIFMTIVVRILMSPLVYKSYTSSAKMKILKPEIEEINKKFPGKDNAMKRQQATMELQRKAGASPLAGCIPALIQMPVFLALFYFFPSNIDLRQKGFLWADDLSSYDMVFKLPFDIPFYGDHVSLFPILAAFAIFLYMKSSQSQQMNMQQPAQEGMPDMAKMMKIMLYISPIMMLVFFNNYASGLSLYYFVSNMLTLGIMLVIKNWIIDEDKIMAKIQENKAKPKKQSKFSKKFSEIMEQAQEQQKRQQQMKKKK